MAFIALFLFFPGLHLVILISDERARGRHREGARREGWPSSLGEAFDRRLRPFRRRVCWVRLTSPCPLVLHFLLGRPACRFHLYVMGFPMN